jgi:hypothetical protein
VDAVLHDSSWYRSLLFTGPRLGRKRRIGHPKTIGLTRIAKAGFVIEQTNYWPLMREKVRNSDREAVPATASPGCRLGSKRPHNWLTGWLLMDPWLFLTPTSAAQFVPELTSAYRRLKLILKKLDGNFAAWRNSSLE